MVGTTIVIPSTATTDDVTLETVDGVLQIKNDGVNTTQIADDAITRQKLITDIVEYDSTGSDVVQAHDAETASLGPSGGYSVGKTMTLASPYTGNIKISYDVRDTGGSGAQYSTIYVDGVQVGTEYTNTGQSSYVTRTETIAVTDAEVITIRYRQSIASDRTMFRNFRVIGTNKFKAISGALDITNS